MVIVLMMLMNVNQHGFKTCEYDGRCYKCEEGEICDDEKYCKPLELYNGCPSNKSIRCDDGRCVQNESDCNKNPFILYFFNLIFKFKDIL